MTNFHDKMMETLRSWENLSAHRPPAEDLNWEPAEERETMFGLQPHCVSPWPSCLKLSEAFFTVAFMLTVMLLIVFGNSMVVLTVNNDQKLRSHRQNWLIVSLAVADLLVGLLIMPLTMIYEIVGIWVLGNVLCELWLALDVLFVTASILHICIISLDRYWSVTQPLTYPAKRTPLRIFTMIGFAWLVSFLICFPPLLGWKPIRKTGECSVSSDLGYVLYSSLGSFYVPVGILVIVYWRIFEITKHHSRQRLKDTQRTDDTLCQLTAAVSIPEISPLQDRHGNYNNSPIKNFVNKKYSCGDNGKIHDAFANAYDTRSATPISDGQATFLATLRQRLYSLAEQASQSLTSPPSAKTSLMTNMTVKPKRSCFLPTATTTMIAASTAATNGSRKNTLQHTLSCDTTESNKISLDKRRRLLKVKERQATLLLGLILTAFIVSWLPFFMMYVLGAFGYQAPILVFKFFFWLGYCNSAINPIIYMLFNREFKRALFRSLRRHQKYFIFIKQHTF